MILRAFLLAMVAFTRSAIAGPSEQPEAENPPPVVSESPELKAWRAKPFEHADRRKIPDPIVKPIPASRLLSWRFEPHGLPLEWDEKRGWIDRRP